MNSSNLSPSDNQAPSKLSDAWTPEVIQALTPILLGMIGCVIGIGALFAPADKATAAMGLAGTAIAGAAGLAKSESFSVEKRGETVKVNSPGSQKPE